MKVYDKVQKVKGTSTENSCSFSFIDLVEKRKSLISPTRYFYTIFS
jgi:hypothetical protein